MSAVTRALLRHVEADGRERGSRRVVSLNGFVAPLERIVSITQRRPQLDVGRRHDTASRMGKVEWFRRSTWTPEDAADFAARLRRSRTPYNKAQYLLIQAGHLHRGGTRELAEAAMTLLDQLVAEYPEPSQLAAAHTQRAECLVDLGLPGDALEAYRRSLEEQRRTPRWRDLAHLGLGELVLALRRRDLYDEALAALDEFGGDELFPVHQYTAAVVRALIADEQGDRDGAHEWARQALAAASKTESPFRYHRMLGLVRTVDPDVLERLSRLAAGSVRE